METTEKAPAKLNLFLDTPYNHSDGLQEWRMVMTSVDLADYVKIETKPGKRAINVHTDTGFLPNDSRNLAYQAAKLLQQEFHVQAGAKIRIKKNIPVAAGMGGGSSDAAAVLRGLNNLWNLKISQEKLAKLGLQIDSDVPYCVYSQTAYVYGKGEKIQLLRQLPAMYIVIAKPRLSVSTPKILRQIDHKNLDHLKIDGILEGIRQNDFAKICANVGNVLEPVTGQLHPQIIQLKDRMLRYGAEAAQMSGTGPTVFGICHKESRAQHLVNSLKGFCPEVYLVRPLN
ncbi:4-diphosphocytidyl-2-C-methyl-D-erythritol kinase [Pediococcus damnosus]|uniref:4-diphosphocytidyl-2-C-methyl-D-erythritol kinase n=1 Tax=Pediococcus damnosus TaxID=51663 RepID=A0A0R2HKC9_9LACO|nr:4-(cytidine 5'-diphospho)-2-C-methyl-D-erythritol kinase [Pediococcus damnosus]AMV60714.1 4-diphosphocytidyl-2-C-methyl-D-erythritol kinase [Pediococcus damnosus]AMV63314.1 4-diphosphocytidyl-2-C-methyl-D-erythritol kinase [Pediococcus damnosus]AMV65029.1 4-diphosphocytidyl-2-C-methyl-D-erythritol kinase [Pediococcus damnosus]AMV66787.1 4-diphosphocytidyl-2-C-methyl-D-erythritol kinase [Pediococcus damnosus]AMV69849.1 4-diphosphocytidyl-2-C-methyl-D-erythritol kinase [Pediococcus damnosus]